MTQDFFIDSLFTQGKMAEKFFKWTKRKCSLSFTSEDSYFRKNLLDFPESWSQLAVDITATKYFKKKRKEKSLRTLVNRVSGELTKASVKQKYLTPKQARIYRQELNYILFSQKASFNSPVWFNLGVFEHPQTSACFIQSLDDSLEGIFDLLKREAKVFKYGSGSGSNFSVLRSRFEELDYGGYSSGLMAFLNVFDSAAGAIKSGGTTRRAAKMVIVDVDHPEIENFIDLKRKEEKKAKVLEAAGYSLGLDGEVTSSLHGQNANNSVRVTDKFMKAVSRDHSFSLRYRRNLKKYQSVNARSLWKKIAQAAYECADPGIQFHDTINRWHTCKESGAIIASNPCSEYMFLDDSSCNLASINLVAFLDEKGQFLLEEFIHTIKVIFFSQELLIDLSSYPSEAIKKNSQNFRPLGIGFTNLGSFLIRKAIPYDSNEARSWAGFLSALLTGYAYYFSAQMAQKKEPFKEFDKNKSSMISVLKKHKSHIKKINYQFLPKDFKSTLEEVWNQVLHLTQRRGLRNAQASVMAPTGTISFMMDCETTGVEPEFSLVKFKKLIGQSHEVSMVNNSVGVALVRMGYSINEIEVIERRLVETGAFPQDLLRDKKHLEIFRTAVGKDVISAEGHLQMMSAIQPFISGAISKTVNMPTEATAEDMERIYFMAWKLGLKSISVYRDQSKVVQPLTTTPNCPECGKLTQNSGGCFVCTSCGTSLSCG